MVVEFPKNILGKPMLMVDVDLNAAHPVWIPL